MDIKSLKEIVSALITEIQIESSFTDIKGYVDFANIVITIDGERFSFNNEERVIGFLTGFLFALKGKK